MSRRLGRAKSLLKISYSVNFETLRIADETAGGKEANKVKILVVDDHPLIQQAMRDVLKEVKADATALEASSYSQAVQVIAEHPDVALILLDLNLPDRDGFSVLTELGERYPAIWVAVLSAQQDPDSINRALDLGALGFLPKSGQRDVMVKALQLMIARPHLYSTGNPCSRPTVGSAT
jgi:DNA-binding NarL/FixJ family response regulator